MFRRLAEAFQTSGNDSHTDYINKQDKYFKTLPNIIPSSTPGLKGFSDAIKSADTVGRKYQQFAVDNPDDIFMPDVSPNLSNFARQCSTSSLDDLIAIKNPSESVGCGWLYTQPNQGSPYPVLSKGFIGNDQGPLPSFNPPEYRKWFFDLQLAKKQMLLDKCKALKACVDVDSNAFKGMCGYCTDTNQGVPIDSVGRPLYSGDSIGNCNPESIVRSGDRCPAPPPPGAGPQPIVDRTCDPVNGRLSAACLYRTVLSAGCSDNGALALSLSGSPNPSDYIANLRNADSVKVYNRVSNPPLNLDFFKQGQATIEQVLTEARLLSANTSESRTSAIGAASRDLCLQKGAIKGYDLCNELSDGSTSPFDIRCLQQLFLKMGGQPAGSMYPSANTLIVYNNMGTLGSVKQFLNQTIANMNSNDYVTQRDSMTQFLGISPEKLINRAPYTQGVEVFWFVYSPGQIGRVNGFLRRTIERDIINLPSGPSRFAQVGGGGNSVFVQLTDIRAPEDFSARFRVVIDDGFWISVNQPVDFDKIALNQRSADSPGYFANMNWQGPTAYQSNVCTEFKATTPNITKMYFIDGGGWMAYQFNAIPCKGTSAFNPPNYSLTCEANAPFLTYEVGLKSGIFEELRNPTLFSQFLGVRGTLDYHTRTDERNSVPGKKSFLRLNSANSVIDMANIAYQSWKTITFAVRLQSMPVKESLINFACGNIGTLYCNLIATPVNGSTAAIAIEHNFGGRAKSTATTWRLSLNKWYIFFVHNRGTGFDLYCYGVNEVVANTAVSNKISIDNNSPLYAPNATWSPAAGQPQQACTILVGTQGFVGGWASMYSTPSFTYDLAWIHFFDKYTTQDDIRRECMANWIYTQFPSSYNNYKSLE